MDTCAFSWPPHTRAPTQPQIDTAFARLSTLLDGWLKLLRSRLVVVETRIALFAPTPIACYCNAHSRCLPREKAECVIAGAVLFESIMTQWQKPRISNRMLSALSLVSPPLTRHETIRQLRFTCLGYGSGISPLVLAVSHVRL